MPIIIAHEETCDIIVNGPTAERPYKDLLKTMMIPVARPCTCGGVQYPDEAEHDGSADSPYRIKPKEANNA